MSLRHLFVDGPWGQAHLREVRPQKEIGKPPVVCLHANPQSGRVFEPLLAELGRDRTAIAIDTPGFGLSAPPPTPPSIEDYAATIGEIIAKHGVGPVDVFGVQTGARIGTALAEARPTLIRRLVLMHAPVWTKDERESGQKNYIPTVAYRDGSHFKKEWDFLVKEWPADADLAQFSDVFCEVMLGIGRPARVWTVPANGKYLYEEHVPGLTLPILVLNPTGWLHPMTARMAPLLRNGRVVDVPYGTMEALLLKAGSISGTVREFLDA